MIIFQKLQEAICGSLEDAERPASAVAPINSPRQRRYAFRHLLNAFVRHFCRIIHLWRGIKEFHSLYH